MKRIIAFALICCALFCLPPASLVTSAGGVLYGDCNRSGAVELDDLTLLAKYIAEWTVTIDEDAANVDDEAGITIIDLTLLAKFLAGWTVELGPKRARSVYLVGDSTICDYTAEQTAATGIMGWGSLLQSYLAPEATVQNYGASGRSSRNYPLSTVYYARLLQNIRAGDFLFIQFGHNDEKIADDTCYTDPNLSRSEVDAEGKNEAGVYSFEWMLYHKYIKVALDAGATPVLLSPIARRVVGGTPTVSAHIPYRAAMRRLGEAEGVAFIDMTEKTAAEWQRVFDTSGAAGTEALHAKTAGGNVDNTHLSAFGADTVAGLAAAGIQKSVPLLARYVVAP